MPGGKGPTTTPRTHLACHEGQLFLELVDGGLVGMERVGRGQRGRVGGLRLRLRLRGGLVGNGQSAGAVVAVPAAANL